MRIHSDPDPKPCFAGRNLLCFAQESLWSKKQGKGTIPRNLRTTVLLCLYSIHIIKVQRFLFYIENDNLKQPALLPFFWEVIFFPLTDM